MEKIYSNSKLQLYESCPEAYKIKYIDKKFPEIPLKINLFLGEVVHESLEWLYTEVIAGKIVELDELLFHFLDSWKKQFSNVRIVNGNAEEYLQKGAKFLVDYYLRNKPFEEKTIAIEKKILFNIGEAYYIQGYIDRLVLNERGEYEIHDYKTNNKLKTQEEIDVDRQLAFYHLGLQEMFGKEIKVKLIWHFLAHDKVIVSRRTSEQLEEIKNKTMVLIKKIESTNFWPACGSHWCDWCEYKKTRGLNKYL